MDKVQKHNSFNAIVNALQLNYNVLPASNKLVSRGIHLALFPEAAEPGHKSVVVPVLN
jgi:hypothetical protein